MKAISCETDTFSISAQTTNTHLPSLSLAPQSLLVGYFLNAIPPKEFKALGIIADSVFSSAKSKQIGDFFPLMCLSSILLFSKFILQLIFRFLLHIDLPRAQ